MKNLLFTLLLLLTGLVVAEPSGPDFPDVGHHHPDSSHALT